MRTLLVLELDSVPVDLLVSLANVAEFMHNAATA